MRKITILLMALLLTVSPLVAAQQAAVPDTVELADSAAHDSLLTTTATDEELEAADVTEEEGEACISS